MSWPVVQSATGTGGTATFAGANTKGNTIVVFSWGTSSSWTPSDSAVNTYVDCGAGAVGVNTNAYYVGIHYCANCKAYAAGNVVNSNDTYGIIVFEITRTGGVAYTKSNANATSGTGGSQTTNALTVAQGTYAVFAGFMNSGSYTETAGTNLTWTGVTNSSAFLLLEYVTFTGTSVTGQASMGTASKAYGAVMAVFTVPFQGRAYVF